jgi:hypothetical protein
MSKLLKWLRKEKPKKRPKAEKFALGFSEEDKAIYREAAPFTMTDKNRVLALIHAVRHIARRCIPGCIVECGVWKGGSMVAISRTLLNLGITNRDLHLFDTFEGMPAPSDKDVFHDQTTARGQYEASRFEGGEGSDWCFSPLEEVKRNVESTGYPKDRIRYIKGKVEDTLPGADLGEIALLRLDTDWYKSTQVELEQLYPLLVSGGVLILDDYYTWQGSKEAYDEYALAHNLSLLLVPVGGGGAVLAVKP